MPALAFQPPARLLPSAASQSQTVQAIATRRLSPDVVRASLERARVAGDFTPGAFEPFAARLPRLLDPVERLTYDGYVAHGLRDLLDRFIVREGDRWTLATYVFPSSAEPTARVQQIISAVDPAQRFTGLTLVNRELARSFLPQFIKGLVIGTVIVVALVKPLGWYMTRVFNGERTFLSPVLRPAEAALYWAGGVDKTREQHWLSPRS